MGVRASSVFAEVTRGDSDSSFLLSEDLSATCSAVPSLFNVPDCIKARYKLEGIVGDDHRHLELRYLLANKYSFGVIKTFAKRIGEAKCVECWQTISEWKINCRVESFAKTSKHKDAAEIFRKYIDCPFFVQSIGSNIAACQGLEECVNSNEHDSLCDVKNTFQHFKYKEDECRCVNSGTVRDDAVDCSFAVTGFDWFLRHLFSYMIANVYAKLEVSTLTSDRTLSPAKSGNSIMEGSVPGTLNSFGLSIFKDVGISRDGSEGSNNLVIKKVFELAKRKHRMSVNDFVFQRVLGEGSFGIVVLCTSAQTNMQYVMKLQEKEEIIRSREDDIFDVSAESTILQKINHPFICKLKAAFRTDALGILVLDYCSRGDLRQFVKSEGAQESLVLKCIAELCSAVAYLHSNGIIHKDIKPGNIMVGSDGHIQLSDFGSATDAKKFARNVELETPTCGRGRNSILTIPALFGETSASRSKTRVRNSSVKFVPLKSNTFCGTDGYMAPEVAYLGYVSHNKRQQIQCYYTYTNAVDWWSVGATAFKLSTGLKPLNNKSMNDILRKYKYVGGADDYLDELACIENPSELQKSSDSKGPLEKQAPPMNGLQKIKSLRGMVVKSFHGHDAVLDEDEAENSLFKHDQIFTTQALSEKIPNASLRMFIVQLLDINFITRLGSGPLGSQNVKGHVLFNNIDWKCLENKQYKLVDDPFANPDTKQTLTADTKSTVWESVKKYFSFSSPRADPHTRAVGGNKNSLLLRTWSRLMKNDSIDMDFDKLLVALGRENWLTNWKHQNFGVYTMRYMSDLLQDWDFESLEMRLGEVGLDKFFNEIS